MTKELKRGLIWFRNDLRLSDNHALTKAAGECQQLAALFIVQPEQWQLHSMAERRIDFMRRQIALLRDDLAVLNIPLLLRHAATFADTPTVVAELAEQLGCQQVYANRELEVNEQQRDQHVAQQLTVQQRTLVLTDDVCILPPGSVLTGKGEPFKVFTPFKRAWLGRIVERGIHCLPRPEPVAPWSLPSMPSADESDAWPNADESDAWPVGERSFIAQLRKFSGQMVTSYQQQRDFPAIDATSKLSPALSIGGLSARQCVARLCLDHGVIAQLQPDPARWLNELIWRDFYKHVLVAFPHVCRDRPFRLELTGLAWSDNKAYFQRWCAGATGFPIVDAAMRQLQQSGWMHNRLRMIVASFLTKDLLLDWRWGERYFMSQLIDGDFAANNGGWQWAASTGTDAAPYFRIFNPVTQGRRFDPKGDFIRLWLPELASVSDKHIHEPWKATSAVSNIDYPKPIVDHAVQRKKALAMFKALSSS